MSYNFTILIILNFPDNNDCDEWINSDTSKNGTFTSPNYPYTYPPNVMCSYHFNGRGKERVQILFNEFDIYKPDDTSKE